ncbi:MAG: nucleoside hydrolase [Pseudomonadota bacterium]
MAEPIPIILDTDPGIDDAMAIFFAAADQRIDLLGLTTVFGNVPVWMATRNALVLAEAVGGIPVAEGAGAPITQALRQDARHVHGPHGLGDVVPPQPSGGPDPRGATAFLAETLAARPGEVTIIAVGPLTNLAAALAHDPAIAEHAAKVVVMGGAVRQGGNVTPHAEANFYQDPHAAEAVLNAPWPVDVIGLDITQGVLLSPAELAPMAQTSPRCGRFLCDVAAYYFRFHKEKRGLDGCYLHDPTAVIRATDPALFEMVAAPIAITLDGEAAGRSREGGTGPAQRFAVGVDIAGVKARFLGALTAGRLP